MKIVKVSLAFATAVLLLGMPKAQSQENDKGHEMSVAVQGLGIGSMPFKSPVEAVKWNDQPGLSLGVNMGYTYWFGERFGFRTGVRLARFSHNQKISNLNLPLTAYLPLNSLGFASGSEIKMVKLIATADAIQEEQHYTFIELPLQLAMRFNDVYLNLGLSLSKAVSATADYSYDNPALAVTEIPELGIVSNPSVPMTLDADTKGDVKNSVMTKPFYCLLDAEVGYNIPLSDATKLAVGLYGRYAPVANKVENSGDMYTLHPDATYTLAQPSATAQVEKVGYYELGVSLGLKFGLGRRHETTTAKTTEPKTNSNYDELASELASVRAKQQKAEEELANVRAKQKKAEEELAAMKDSQKKAQDELDNMKSENERAKANAAKAANTANTATAANIAKSEEADKKPEKKADKVNTPIVDNKTEGRPVEGIMFHFDYNKTTPLYDNTTDSKLRELCSRMQNNSNIRVLVVGHTDAVGTHRNNNRVGRRRAKKVKQMMIDLGVSEENIEIVTRGKREPIDSNNTDKGRANNRRVTIEEL